MLKLYDQTTFSNSEAGTHGDCNRACVATLLQIDPSTLPHPILPEDGWNPKYHKALRDMGYTLRTMKAQSCMFGPDRLLIQDDSWGGFMVPRLVMGVGKTNRGPWLHAVIWDLERNRMVHDPHPSGVGIQMITDIDYIAPYPKPKS